MSVGWVPSEDSGEESVPCRSPGVWGCSGDVQHSSVCGAPPGRVPPPWHSVILTCLSVSEFPLQKDTSQVGLELTLTHSLELNNFCKDFISKSGRIQRYSRLEPQRIGNFGVDHSTHNTQESGCHSCDLTLLPLSTSNVSKCSASSTLSTQWVCFFLSVHTPTLSVFLLD